MLSFILVLLHGAITKDSRVYHTPSEVANRLQRCRYDGVLNGSIPLRFRDSSDCSVYHHRLSYSPVEDCYYENGQVSEPLASSFRHPSGGVWAMYNISREVEQNHEMAYLSRQSVNSSSEEIGVIGWRLHFMSKKYILESVKLRLESAVHDEMALVTWMIRPLSKAIMFDNDDNKEEESVAERCDTPFTSWIESVHGSVDTKDMLLATMESAGFARIEELSPQFDIQRRTSCPPPPPFDATELLRGEYGFEVYAVLSGGTQGWPRIKAQLFRTSTSQTVTDAFNGDIDNADLPCCPFDIRTTWRPFFQEVDFIQLEDSVSEQHLAFDDELTADFTVVLAGDRENPIRLHSSIVARNSRYFEDLLRSTMVESRQMNVTIEEETNETAGDRIMLRKCLRYLYIRSIETASNEYGVDRHEMITARLPSCGTVTKLTADEWIQAMHYAARFGIPSLFRMCEIALANQPESHPCIAREDLLDIAQTYGAHQLLKYVEHEPIIRAYLEHEPYLCPHLTMDSERLHSAGIEHWFAKFSR